MAIRTVQTEIKNGNYTVTYFYGSHPPDVRWDGYTPTAEEVAAAEQWAADNEAAIKDNLARVEAAPKIMARWASYNAAKLDSGQWSYEDFATFMPLTAQVSSCLFSLAFGTARDLIDSFEHPLATAEAKADYIQIMRDEYPPLG